MLAMNSFLERTTNGFVRAVERGDLDGVKQHVRELKRKFIQLAVIDGRKTALHVASEDNSGEIVTYILDECPNIVNMKDSDGWTALHLAARKNHVQIVRTLVERGGADVNAVTFGDRRTALHIAAQAKSIDCVRYLVGMGRGGALVQVPKALADDDSIAAHASMKPNEQEAVKHLSGKGFDVNAADRKGCKALHLASRKNRLEAVKCLIAGRANVEAVNTAGLTALHEAAMRNHVSVARTLILPVQGCANVEARTRDEHCTNALHLAVCKNHVTMVTLLLSDGHANIEAMVSDKKLTPLHAAALLKHVSVAKCLTSHGANVEAVDEDGCTPLHLACDEPCVDLVHHLVEQCHANLEATDKDGWTPLHYAASRLDVATVSYLVSKAGANMYSKTTKGNTAFHIAAGRRASRKQRIGPTLVLVQCIP